LKTKKNPAENLNMPINSNILMKKNRQTKSLRHENIKKKFRIFGKETIAGSCVKILAKSRA
jgi:hypothetical protein